jgi:hypothetical protein
MELKESYYSRNREKVKLYNLANKDKRKDYNRKYY